MSASGPLANLVVVDASDGVAGHFAARMMADNGATVTLVEPPGGGWVRRQAPFSTGDDRPAMSHLHSHLNSGKRTCVVDPGSPAGRRELLRRVAAADVAMVGDRALAADLIEADPDVVVGLVTDFAAEGPYADWTGTELIHQALSGSMYVNGLPEREPLYGVGHRSYYAAGVWLYTGVLAALHARRAGRNAARLVDVSVHEAAAAMEQNFTTQWAYTKTIPVRGEAERARARGRVRCQDGWVIFMIRDGQWPAACAVFDCADAADDERFDRYGPMLANWPTALAMFEERARHRTARSLLASAMRHELVLAPVCDPVMLLEDEHLAARGFWRRDRREVGEMALGPMFRFSSHADTRREPDTARRVSPQLSGEPQRPLFGTVVLDVTTAWAGPMATRILAHLGAHVVKIEGPDRPDDWRGVRENAAVLEWYPDREPGDRSFDRHSWFNSQNHDKRSVVLDLKDPRGARLGTALGRGADVVVSNFSPGTLSRLGLDYESLSADNDGVVVVEMTAAGRSGPRAMQRGLGPTMEAMAGISAFIGYESEGPVGSGTAYLDPAGGLHGAAAAVTALIERQSTGRGQEIEISQQEAGMHWIGEWLLDGIEHRTGPVLRGNAAPWAVPHDAFPAAGDDQWVAIAVMTDQQWRALRGVLADDGVVVSSFATLELRRRHAAEIDRAIRAWAAMYDKSALATRLQQVGVPAAPVCTGQDLYEDPQLRASGWFTTLDHPVAGRHEYAGLPLCFDGERNHPRRASPPFGQDTAAVLRDRLDLADDAIAALYDSGVTTTAPRAAYVPRMSEAPVPT